MAILRLLLSSCLIFFVSAIEIKDAIGLRKSTVVPCLAEYVTSIKHDAEIILFVEKANGNGYCYSPYHVQTLQETGKLAFYGKSTVVFNITRPTKIITLRLQQPRINGLTFTIFTEQRTPLLQKYDYDYDTQSFNLYYREVLETGMYILITDFVSSMDDIKGLSAFSYESIYTTESDRWLVAMSDFQSVVSQMIFPCLDRAESNANLTISIKHNIYSIVSNIKQTEITYEKGLMSWKFNIAPTAHDYLVFIALDDFVHYVNEQGDIKMWCRQKIYWYLQYLWDSFVKVPKFLEEEWYMNKLNVTMNHLVMPSLQDGMTSLGLIFYREADVIFDEILDHPSIKRKVRRSISRKMINQYFNNTASWLLDGLVTMMEVDTTDKLWEKYRMQELFVVQTQQESLNFDTFFYGKGSVEEQTTEISTSRSYFPYYNKAPFIMRMLQHLIGEKVFKKGFQKYIDTRKHLAFNTTNTFAVHFWKSIQDAFNENMNKTKQIYDRNINLTALMIDWLKQKHCPIVTLTRNYDAGWITVHLESPFSLDMSDWIIPLSYTSQSHLNFHRTRMYQVEWVKIGKSSGWPIFSGFPVNYRENGWIIVNLQQAGYYRVNYDTNNWNRIAVYLNSKEFDKIHVINRAQIIDDLFYLALHEIQPFPLFWKITSYLSEETDYIAWYPMLKAIEHMSKVFVFQNQRADDIKSHLHKILGGVLEKIGYYRDYKESNLTSALRQEAARWACALNHKKCLEKAHKKLTDYLIYPLREILYPWWKVWVYCEGLKLATYDTWKQVLNTFIYKDTYLERITLTNTSLKVLACSPDIEIIKTYLSHLESDAFKIKDIDKINIFRSIIARHANDVRILDIIFSTYQRVKPRNISTIKMIIDIINHVYTEELLQRVATFIDSNVRVLYSRYSKIYSDLQDKVNSRMFEIKKHEKYLKLLRISDQIVYPK